MAFDQVYNMLDAYVGGRLIAIELIIIPAFLLILGFTQRLFPIIFVGILLASVSAQAANYPWAEIFRGKCLPAIERQYHTGGDWVFDVARCTAHFYPPTAGLSPERCVAQVWNRTKDLCQQCAKPGRVDQVMLCLTGR